VVVRLAATVRSPSVAVVRPVAVVVESRPAAKPLFAAPQAERVGRGKGSFIKCGGESRKSEPEIDPFAFGDVL
jgi:hypothetical protein